MPTIKHAELAITTDQPLDIATVTVSCDVEFTEVEYNAMDILGLRYTLQCQVLNNYMLNDDPVVTFGPYTYPRFMHAARLYEHAVFETTVPMFTLNERVFGKDILIAELKLKNEETGEEVVERTGEIKVDLAA